MGQLLLVSVGAAFLAYFGVRFLFKRDTAVEERRLGAIDLSETCAKNGLPLLSKVLRRYSVGDYSGLAFAVRDVKDTISDPDQLKDVVDRFLGVQLDKKLATYEGRRELLKAIEDRLGIEIPVEVLEGGRKIKLLTEDEAEAIVESVASGQVPPVQQPLNG